MVRRDLFNNQNEFSSFEISPSGSQEEVLKELEKLTRTKKMLEEAARPFRSRSRAPRGAFWVHEFKDPV
ncbi:hypothetical protein K1719_026414 [Acacia pycnantha]|nr:hypothetical protein K1719_026414 [Acacia pycnantha]